MIIENIVFALKDGFYFGVAHGSFCSFSCGPLFSLFFSRNRENKYYKDFLFFLSGRFFGYMFAGLIVGSISKYYKDFLPGIFLQRFSYLMLGGYLFYFLSGEKKGCLNKKKKPYWEYFANSFFVLGFLGTFRICVPVVVLILRCLSYGNIFMSVIAFLSFFITISIFFIPYLFIGRILSEKVFDKAVKVVLFIFGLYFVLKGFGLF